MSTQIGHDTSIADYYDDEFRSHARIVEAVAIELDLQANAVLPPGHDRMKGKRKKAARVARSRFRPLLDSALKRPSSTPPELEQIELTLVNLALRKPRDLGSTPHPDEHKGEAESIHWSIIEQAHFVACDSDARQVAGINSVIAITFVEVVRRIGRRRKDVTVDNLYEALVEIARAEISIGEPVRSSLDLV